MSHRKKYETSVRLSSSLHARNFFFYDTMCATFSGFNLLSDIPLYPRKRGGDAAIRSNIDVTGEKEPGGRARNLGPQNISALLHSR